jgi:hypothetical protein
MQPADAEVVQPGLGGRRAPRLGRAAAAGARLELVFGVGVRGERLELVHEHAAAADRAAEVLTTDQAHGWDTGIRWPESGEVRRPTRERPTLGVARR